MARATVKNLDQVTKGLQQFVGKAQETTLRRYRSAVWAVFTRILDTTPQFTGKAVANWNIGVDSPDLSVELDVGDLDETWGMGVARQRGDRGWVEYAMAKNKPRLALIMSHSRVFISNSVTGDLTRKDKALGGNSPSYLADLQSSSYWVNKLRDENRPYETVSEVMINESWRQNLHRNTKNTGEDFFITGSPQ